MKTRKPDRSLFEPLESRQLFSAGALDPTFGAGGIVPGIPGFTALATTVQRDGKVVLAGTWGHDIAVARLTSGGTLDGSFGGTGMVTTQFGGYDYASGIAVQPDGKIVAAGMGHRGAPGTGNGRFVVVRYNPNGTLDTTFDGDGKVSFNHGPEARFGDMTLQRDGKIVLVGSRINAHLFDLTDNDFLVVRLLPNGRLDQTFGRYDHVTHQRRGWTNIELGGKHDRAHAVVLQADGKIVVGGSALVNNAWRFAVARLKADGTLDNTFDADGRATTRFPNLVADGGSVTLNDLAVQGDGRIVAAGTAEDHFTIVRYNPTGSLDPTFGGDGIVMTDFEQAGFEGIDSVNAVMLTPQKRILAVGETARGEFAAVRYMPDGALDPSFASAGRLKVPAMGRALAVARAPEGKAVITAFGGKTMRVLETIPQVNLAGWDRRAAEAGADPGSFIVTRDGIYDFPTRVYVTRGGTATPGIDYSGPAASPNGYIEIPAGESFALVEVTPIDDATPEGDETVQLIMRPGAHYAIGSHSGGTVTIADNDGSLKPRPGSTGVRPPPRALRALSHSPLLGADPLHEVEATVHWADREIL